MVTHSKSEIATARNYLFSLKKAKWMTASREWWPDYLFHCTDITNVVNILQTGFLMSRTQAIEAKALNVDIAPRDIIDHTSEHWHDYVRLYFRPKTPTQYRNEGHRPKNERYLGAQCPVPVYLLFDAVSVLSLPGSAFTDGNLASGAIPQQSLSRITGFAFSSNLSRYIGLILPAKTRLSIIEMPRCSFRNDLIFGGMLRQSYVVVRLNMRR